MKRFLTWLLLAALSFSAAGATIVANGPARFPAASGVAPTIVNSAFEVNWDNADVVTKRAPAAGPTAWSVAIGDVIIIAQGVWNNNNTGDFSTATCVLFDGTAAISGGFVLDNSGVRHTGSATDGVAIWSGVVTTAGTWQVSCAAALGSGSSYGANIAAGAIRGANATGARVNAINGATYTTGTTPTTGAAATGGAGFMIAVLDTNTGQVSITEDSPWLLIAETDTASVIYRIVSTNTSDDGSWVLSASDQGASTLVTYKALVP